MGASLDKVMEKLTNDSQSENEMKDLMNALQREADHEADSYFNKIIHSNLETHKIIPISCVLYKYYSLEILVEKDQQKLLKVGIQDMVEKVTSSNISGAISSVLSTAITALLGKRGSEVSTEENYTVSIGKLGGVERFDYRLALKTFSSETFQSKMQSVLSVIVVISSCDIDRLKANDTAVLVQQCFGSESYDVQNAVRELLYIAMDDEISPEKKADLELPLVTLIDEQYLGKIGVSKEEAAKLKQEFKEWKEQKEEEFIRKF